VKTLVDEQEVQSGSPAIPQKARVPEARIQSQAKAEAKRRLLPSPKQIATRVVWILPLFFLRAGDVPFE